MYERLIDSPVGLLTLRAEDGALTAILFGDQRTGLPGSDQILDQAEAELKEYFAGERKEFTVPVRLMGTDFQKKVWAALAEIPYGGRPHMVRSLRGSEAPRHAARWEQPITTIRSPLLCLVTVSLARAAA